MRSALLLPLLPERFSHMLPADFSRDPKVRPGLDFSLRDAANYAMVLVSHFSRTEFGFSVCVTLSNEQNLCTILIVDA